MSTGPEAAASKDPVEADAGPPSWGEEPGPATGEVTPAGATPPLAGDGPFGTASAPSSTGEA
ncbi:hypothetical protein ACFYOA_32140, partial [Streptomyces iakyrus]|uniref:hypothetical protein n=1 Tax=Streptomyces iakyrus TaxID=68219 RepID=UPI0036CD5808